MGCGMSHEAEPEEEPRVHHKKDHNTRRRRSSSSSRRRKGAKRNFAVIHRCKSGHPECRDVLIVSPFIERPDGSRFRVSWAPCGLEFAREYIRDRAAHPEIADLLSNQPVSPVSAHMAGAGGTAEMEPDPESSDDDMVHDVADDPDDPHAGENIETGHVPAAFPKDDMVYDLPVPPAEAYVSGGRKKGKKAKMVPGPFGRPVPAPGQGGMMSDDAHYTYAGGYAGEGEYYMDDGMGHAATGGSGDNSGGSWAGSTVPPASRPPRATYVSNRHENLYHGDEFQESEFVDPPGVAVAQEERRPPRTATGYTATSENYNTVQYSRDYRNY